MDSTLIWYHYSQGKQLTAIGLGSEKSMYTKVGISPPGIETGSFHTQVALFLHQGTFPTMTCDTAKDFHAPISTQLLLHSHVHVFHRKRMRNLVSASRYRVCRGSPNLVVMGSPMHILHCADHWKILVSMILAFMYISYATRVWGNHYDML